MSRMESVNRILRNLQAGTPDVEACALVSEDGLMIASALPQHIDETRVAGMTATLASLGIRAAEELERGEVDQVFVKGKNGYAIMFQASENTLLLVMASRNAKLGLIFLDTQRAAAQVQKVI
ncbi:MAG: roadblock/LC7 domain-containing protein [bacterium]